MNHGLPALLHKLRSLKQKWLPTVTKMHLHCDCAYFGTGQSSRTQKDRALWGRECNGQYWVFKEKVTTDDDRATHLWNIEQLAFVWFDQFSSEEWPQL